MRDRKCGSGGGGAYVEAIIITYPGEKLRLQVGAGGQQGNYGIVEADIDEETGRRIPRHIRTASNGGFPGKYILCYHYYYYYYAHVRSYIDIIDKSNIRMLIM